MNELYLTKAAERDLDETIDNFSLDNSNVSNLTAQLRMIITILGM